MEPSRRDFLRSLAVGSSGLLLETADLFSSNQPNATRELDDLLVELERRACLYFYEQAAPSTGLVKDRARHTGRDTHNISSIAATGFGLSAMCIAHQNGFLKRSDAKQRVQTTLEFLARKLHNEHGFFFHFVDMESGGRAFQSEISSIDTAILLLGVLHCRTYFDTREIRQLATEIYERVDWKWMLNSADTLDHGWKPESGFLKSRWDSYSELKGLYLLAIGSPSHPIPASSWQAWERPMFQYDELNFIGSPAPIFVHQSAEGWIDFRGRHDRHTNYFENSRIATLAHKRFCISLSKQFPWYSNELWGITASDSENGYVVWGGPPAMGPIDGTIVPCAAGGSLVFLPGGCKLVLKTIFDRYPKAWTRYGFVDAFHPRHDWYDPEVLGIDQGIMLLMAENLRNEGVWKSFMRNEEIVRAMNAVGLVSS
jgi:hypothetical protein